MLKFWELVSNPKRLVRNEPAFEFIRKPWKNETKLMAIRSSPV